MIKFFTTYLLKIISSLNLSTTSVYRYGTNAFWLFIEQILQAITGLLVGVWVARYLGPTNFGLFNYSLAFVALFKGIAKLGLDGILIRDLVREPEKASIYLGTAFWLKLFAGIFSICIILLATLLTKNDPKTNLYIFIISLGIILQSLEVIDFYFQSKVLLKVISKCKIFQNILSSIIKIILIIVNAELFWFVLTILIDIFILSISYLFLYNYHRNPTFYKYFEIDLAKRLLKDSWPLILTSIAITIYMRIDQVMLKNLLGDKEVGLYSAALRLIEKWYFIPGIITQLFFPALVSAYHDKEKFYKRLSQLTFFLGYLGLLISLTLSIFSKFIISLLYGNKYLESAPILSIASFTIFILFWMSTTSRRQAIDFQKIAFLGTVSSAIANILLNLILIPKFGAIGAAIASLLSFLIAGPFFLFIHPKGRENFFVAIKSLIFPHKVFKP